ncbi:MAG: hypothetical protein SFV15_09125 [Polyangiaceae bacterium]|nr:hypothetical protein [Polyangiaceae bacterium]
MKSLTLRSVRIGVVLSLGLLAATPMPGCTAESRQFGESASVGGGTGDGGSEGTTGGALGNSGGAPGTGGTVLGASGASGSGGVSNAGASGNGGMAGMPTGISDIPCATSAACSLAAPYCNVAKGFCVECIANEQCSTGSCNVDLGACTDCGSDADCMDPNKPRCDTASKECAPCVPTNDNCPQGKKCVAVNDSFACADGCKNDGDCSAANGPNSICCGDVCVDKSSDSAHCGQCGMSCGTGTCCSAACVNFDTDPNNCGGCGRVCSNMNIATPICDGGQCVGACDSGFGDCDSDKRTNGCEVSLHTDTANCGRCGAACSSNNISAPACAGGACTGACNSGTADCNNDKLTDGCEIDTTTNADNCGGCGMACSAGGMQTRTCANSQCNGTCATGAGDCDNNKRTNGCELDTTSSADNCGGCGMVCSNAGMQTRTCAANACNGTCAAGKADCNANKKTDGCEIDTNTDPNNCGGCGIVCSNAGMQTRTCVAGVCSGTCAAGKADCNGNKQADGCEIDIATNPDNCGGCGMACSNTGMATRTCGGGNCNGTCAAPAADCNGNKRVDGCEINTATNPDNCGGCGSVCSNSNMATRTCGAGVCNGTCAANYGDCNANKKSDGCEVNLTNDKNNCAACGNVCNLTCLSSQCTWDTGPRHGFAGLSSNHYITQGGCSVGGGDAADAAYFCSHFYGSSCTAQSYVGGATAVASAPKMHKNGSCTDQGNNITGRTCDGGPCKIGNTGNISVSTTGINDMVCRCPNNVPFAQFGGREWYKVQVFGAMTDANVKAACLAAGLKVPCTGAGGCMYNDGQCSPTAEMGCSVPMNSLSQFLCAASPTACPPLFGVYQNMGGTWVGGSACGADSTGWCIQGASVNNKYALCVN